MRSLLIVLLCASPAAAQGPLAELRAADARVAAINWQLATRNAGMCSRRVQSLGIRLDALPLYAANVREEAMALFGLGFQPSIMVVVPGSAAAKSGAAVGDVLLRINDAEVTRIAEGKTGADAMVRLEQLLDAPDGASAASIDVLRTGKRIAISITGDGACASRIELLPSAKLNARADGETVRITTAVVNETRNESELAFVIAHEMAHNILEHPAKLKALGKRTKHVRATEIEADKMAIRLMRGAGYDPLAAARFWERFGKKTGFGIFSDGTHLRTKARVELLEQEAAKAAQ